MRAVHDLVLYKSEAFAFIPCAKYHHSDSISILTQERRVYVTAADSDSEPDDTVHCTIRLLNVEARADECQSAQPMSTSMTVTMDDQVHNVHWHI